MNALIKAVLIAGFGSSIAAPAQAATTIDFSGNSSGTSIGSTYAGLGVVFSNAVFATCGGGCPAPTPNGNFAYGGTGQSFTATFTRAQNAVSFQSVSFSSTLASAYDAGGNLLATLTDDQGFPITNQVDAFNVAGITRIVFSPNGGYNGPAITNLSFTGGVPEPATWALMLLGFGAVGFALRRQRAARIAISYA